MLILKAFWHQFGMASRISLVVLVLPVRRQLEQMVFLCRQRVVMVFGSLVRFVMSLLRLMVVMRARFVMFVIIVEFHVILLMVMRSVLRVKLVRNTSLVSGLVGVL